MLPIVISSLASYRLRFLNPGRGLWAVVCFIVIAVLAGTSGYSSEADSSITQLLQAAESKDPEVRGAALNELVGNVEAWPQERAAITETFTRHVNDKNGLARNAAVVGLTYAEPMNQDIVPLLTEVIRNSEPAFKPTVVMLLGRMGADAKEAVPVLIEAMKKERGPSVYVYVQALENIGTPEALEAAKPVRHWLEIKDWILVPIYFLILTPWIAALVGLGFALLFCWGRRCQQRGGKIIYWPLIIPIIFWGAHAYPIVFGGTHAFPYRITDPDLGRLFLDEGLLAILTILATLAGLVPWAMSRLLLWKLERHTGSPAAPVP